MLRSSRNSNNQRERLAAWLCEWETNRRLQPEDHDALNFIAPHAYPVQVRSKPIKLGAIRLLAPDTLATAARPVYVAVLANVGPELWQVAPFGRFATPALPGELGLQRRAVHLQVLCLWNTAVLNGVRLDLAYPAGRLTVAEWQAVTAVRASMVGTPLPPCLTKRVGPKLVHPLDPRQLYVEEERALWLKPIATETKNSASDLLMAAETRVPY